MKVFVSYSSADRPVAAEIADTLRDHGFEVMIDFQLISPGEEWRLALRNAIKESDGVVMLVSHAYLDSEFCRLELETARIFNRFLCTPILIDDCWNRLLSDKSLSELCENVPIDFYRGEFAGLKVPREVLKAKLIDGFNKARDLWGEYEGADVVLGSMPSDHNFTQALAEELRATGLTVYTIAEHGYAGQAVPQLMYYFMERSKFCAIVISPDCLQISSIVGSFALASEEHGLPVVAVATLELSEQSDRLAAEIQSIQQKDRVFARVLDRQLILSNRSIKEVASDVRDAALRASRRESDVMGHFGRILSTLWRLIQTAR